MFTTHFYPRQKGSGALEENLQIPRDRDLPLVSGSPVWSPLQRLCCVLAAWGWTSHFSSLGLSVLTEMGIFRDHITTWLSTYVLEPDCPALPSVMV